MNSLAAPLSFQLTIPSDLAEARRLQAEIQSALEMASFAERVPGVVAVDSQLSWREDDRS